MDGAYHGWQNQPNAISVQEVVEKALTTSIKRKCFYIVGAGRTDAGVHAVHNCLHILNQKQDVLVSI